MQDWKILSEEVVKTGYRKIVRRKYEMPDGKIEEYDIKDEGKCVCILALTPENEVILAKQFRPGPGEILLELPGGGSDSLHQTPEENAKRELLEETGFTGDFQFIGTCWNCAYSNRVTYNFIATNCHKVQDQELDETEFIEVVLLPLAEFRQLLQSGELTDVKTGYLGLDYLKLL